MQDGCCPSNLLRNGNKSVDDRTSLKRLQNDSDLPPIFEVFANEMFLYGPVKALLLAENALISCSEWERTCPNLSKSINFILSCSALDVSKLSSMDSNDKRELGFDNSHRRL